ncbi:MAG: histidinol dehydrogenase, partial [Candidatus Diapherotrites archaeon]|nr:histidinol dehydrogenase [Candidatus Diapherotrites archaeon]
MNIHLSVRLQEKSKYRGQSKIIRRVQSNGDAAVRFYNRKFDSRATAMIRVPSSALRKAYNALTSTEKKSLQIAARNIAFFCRQQRVRPWKTKRDGIVLGERVLPVERVGIYVPGGRFALPSSLLMCAIPAQIAKVKQLVVCTPQNKNTTVLGAAYALGIKKVFFAGGAQAIAAMTFGTQTIPKVDKIVGPGNVYVATAKRLLYGVVDLDMPAGPSEVVVFANTGNPDWIASELLAQAEHDPLAKAILLTTSPKLATRVKKLAVAPNVTIVQTKSIRDAIARINRIGPEHLVLWDTSKYVSRIENAGSIFIGPYSAVAFGDYCSGTNHVLPTNGFSRC